jgi:hypothetical protein
MKKRYAEEPIVGFLREATASYRPPVRPSACGVKLVHDAALSYRSKLPFCLT